MASAWDGSNSNRGDEDSFASRDDNNGKRRSKSSDLETKKRRSKTLTLRRKRNSQTDNDSQPVEPSWKRTIKQKLPSRLRRARGHGIPDPRPSPDEGNCVCTSYRRTEDHFLGPGIVFSASQPPSQRGLLDFSKFNPNDYPTEDLDELRYQQRLAEMDAGIELSNNRTALTSARTDGLASSFDRQCTITSESVGYPNLRDVTSTPFSDHSSETIYSDYEPRGDCGPTVVHTQIDYIHCLVPDLEKVTNCGYYWGVMDRYEAESLLDNKPEGTFLLRDSAQDEFLFSVSFRRYGRSLHARIEQWNHKFSFDSHDPAVFASDTVHGLIEHYKDPGSCLFFEPMLIYPLNRTHVFSLQNLCRAVICSNVCYDGINYLNLPKSLKESLRYYHYKQKVRVRKFEISHV